MTTHNKKRNTAFLFEILIKEQTKCILKKQDKKALFIEKLINKFFSPNSLLMKELTLYHTLSESSRCTPSFAEKLITNVKLERDKLSDKQIYESQSKLISIINKSLGSDTFSNFVENYKNLASINILFNKQSSIKHKTEIENVIKESLIYEEKKEELIKEEVNFLVYKKFLENFNEEYKDLLSEQKVLLNQYIYYKFGNDVDFKIHLNNECLRILRTIEKKKELVKENQELYQNIDKCINELKNLSFNKIDDMFIYKIMKYQELERELVNE